jgi:transposase
MKNESIIRERRNRYDKAFKEQAVRMWMNSGRSAEFTAKELGVSVFDLYKWGRDMKEIKQVEPEREPTTLAEYKEKVKRLEKELARVTEQREILKKAAGILSQTPPSGMP